MAQQVELQQYQPLPGQLQPPSQKQHPTSSAHSDPCRQIFSTTMKNYDMMYTTSRTNARLHLGSSSGPCAYYAQSVLLSTHPQIQLRRGSKKSAPMVAFARGNYTSRNIMIGSGDHEKDPDIKLSWEELCRERNILHCSDWEFSTAVESGPRQTYRWRRNLEHCAKTIYDCVDETGQVVAKMLSGGFFNFNKGGETKIAEGLDLKLEELLIISALAIWGFEAGGSVFQGYPSKGRGVDGSLADHVKQQ